MKRKMKTKKVNLMSQRMNTSQFHSKESKNNWNGRGIKDGSILCV